MYVCVDAVTDYLDERANVMLATREPIVELYDVRATVTYSCFVNNTAGSAQKLFHLVVQAAPTWKAAGYEYEQRVSLHHSLDLTCETNGSPEASVTWVKDGQQLGKHDEGLFFGVNGQTLRLLAAKLTDAGTYQCVASNALGQISREFHVTIDGKLVESSLLTSLVNGNAFIPAVPTNGNLDCFLSLFTDAPKVTSTLPSHVTLLPNETTQFECSGTGSPPPTAVWLFNGTAVLHEPTLYLAHGNASTGTYTCQLESSEGTDRHSMFVSVLRPPQRLSGMNHTDSLTPLKVRTDEPLVLVCPFENFNSLLWQLNERALEEHFDLTDVRLKENLLIIDRIRARHQGTYTISISLRPSVFI